MTNIVNSAITALKANILGKPRGEVTYGTGPVLPRKTDMLNVGNSSTTPLARMEMDPYAFSTHMYPKDAVNDLESGHYIMFYVNVSDSTRYTYQGYKGGEWVNTGGKIMKESGGGHPEIHGRDDETFSQGGTQTPSYITEQGQKADWTFINNDVAKLRKNKTRRMTGIAATKEFEDTTRITDSVTLYLPANVRDEYGVNYTATETGMLGFLAATAGGMIGDWKSDDFVNFLRKGLGGLSGVMQEGIKKMLMGIAEGLTASEGGVELANKIFQRAENPYLEVLFNSPKMRQFTYNFTFAPKDEAEQAEVKNIIQLFRFHMAPELRTDHNRFFTLPSEFDISYMYVGPDGGAKENPWYNKISTCVLSDCNVDYTPTGVKSHIDGSPVLIKMALTFQETEMITKDHIKAGY